MKKCSSSTSSLIIIIFIITMLFIVNQVTALRCYVCGWTAAYCQDFNCYNNPDVCTNMMFSPTIVQSIECPAGCETYSMTDPNGLVQQWRRNCDSSGDTVGKRLNPAQTCSTTYQLGLRITRCTCNDHLCNGATSRNLITATNLIFVIIFASLKVFHY